MARVVPLTIDLGPLLHTSVSKHGYHGSKIMDCVYLYTISPVESSVYGVIVIFHSQGIISLEAYQSLNLSSHLSNER